MAAACVNRRVVSGLKFCHKPIERSQQSWTCRVRECLESGDFHGVLNTFQVMQDECAPPSRDVIRGLLKACTRLRCIERGQCVHVEIAKQGLEGDSFLASSLVDMYAKCGSLAESKKVFDKLEDKDVVTWTALIAGYAEHGFGEEALQYLRDMQLHGATPNDVTFVCCLKGCSSIGAKDRGKELHAKIAEEGFERELFVGTSLVDLYVKCGLLAEAQDVFDEISKRSVVSWNAFIAGLAEAGLTEKVLACLIQMHAEDLFPDAFTFISSLKGCNNVGDLATGQGIHTLIALDGLENDPCVGGALVELYAKCGLYAESQKVFNELTVRDLASWNALMLVYSENFLHKEVLDCVVKMKLEGTSPDVATWVCCLRACSSLQAVNNGQAIHAEIVKVGFERDSFISSSVVDMCAKCGALEEAQQVFDELPNPSLGSWTALIAGFAEHGLDEQASLLLERLQMKDVVLDRVALLCCLKACGTLGFFEKAQELHIQVAKEGYEKDISISNTLVDIYGKCGLLREAQEIFDELPVQDIVSWNALIAGYAQHGNYEIMLNHIQQMRMGGIFPSAATFICVLKACGNNGDLCRGQQLHAEIVREGFEEDSFIGSTVIEMYSRCGAWLEAQEVLNELTKRNEITWNALIAGYAEQGLLKETLHYFEQMQLDGFSPAVVTYIWILKVCGSRKSVETGQEIHIETVKKGFERDPFLGSALVDMYAKGDALTEAQEVFNKLSARDVVSWTALIAGYTEGGFGKEALNCLEHMQREGFVPNAITYLCSLKACAGLRGLDKGRNLHMEIAREGFETDVWVGTSLVDMYAKCGKLAEAREVLADLQLNEVVSWTALITGCVEQGLGEDALYCFEEMIQEGLCPNMITFLCMLQACGCIGVFDKGRGIHSMIVEEGLESEPLVGSTLVDMYAKCGSLAEALEVFEELPIQDLFSLNALIAGYASQGEVDLVFLMLARMEKESMLPDKVTFLKVLFACSHAGLVDQGVKFFDIFSRLFGIAATIEHYNCMIDLFCRAGQFSMALATIERMPFQPNLVTWSIMMGACRKWGNLDFGKHAFACHMGSAETHHLDVQHLCGCATVGGP